MKTSSKYLGMIFDPKNPKNFNKVNLTGKRSANITPFKIIEIENSSRVLIRFLDKRKIVSKNGKIKYEGGYEYYTSMTNILKNGVKNPYQPTVEGVGYIGSEYSSGFSKCDAYKSWNDMIKRCYNKKELEKLPSYEKVTVGRNFLNYSNFKKFYDKYFYTINNEKMNLDKDILFKKNKIYTSKNCVFVPITINKALISNERNRNSELPIGVRKEKNCSLYIACIDKGGKRTKIRGFKTKEEAFNCYKSLKEEYIHELAEKYKKIFIKENGIKAFKTNKYKFKDLYNALINFKVEIDD